LVAEVSWNVSAQYDFPVGPRLNGFARVEVNRVGDRWNTFQSKPGSTLMDSYVATNLRMGIGGGNWSAAIYANNLFDEYIVTYVPFQGARYDVLDSSRVIGVNARHGF
jgi:outer membrane receptor protein involved in Fe transport